MNLPFRNQGGPESPPVIPEMNAPLPVQPPSGSGILWWRVAILALATVAVIVLLFLAGRWAVHKTSHKSTKPSVSTSSTDKNTSTSKSGSTAPKSSPSQAQNSGSTATPQPSASSAAPTNNGTATNLTNTGPGETAAVFIITAASGVVGYQVLLRRREE